MILILMQSRSGSSLVASIFAAHGFDTKHSNSISQFGYMYWEHEPAKAWLRDHKRGMGYATGVFCKQLSGIESVIDENDCVKTGVEYWPCFKHLDYKLFIVRRDPWQICKSLQEKRNPRSRKLQPPREMWQTVKTRERMLDQARDEGDGVDIHTERLVAGDFSEIRKAFEHHGIEFNEDKARGCIQKEKYKQR